MTVRGPRRRTIRPLPFARRLLRSLGTRGLGRTTTRLLEEIEDRVQRVLTGESPYERWQRSQEPPSGDTIRLRTAIASWSHRPLLSVVMPVHDPDPRWLERALASLSEQIYPHWQLCIADDASTRPDVIELLRRSSQQDPRIDSVRLPRRRGIATASNAALGLARGDFVVFLDHDDELTRNALLEVAKTLRDEDYDLLYSDEDKISTTGHLSDPTFKPGLSPDLLLAFNYFGHLCVYRRQLLERLGGLDPRFDGAQDHDLALRAVASGARVRHLPKVLYHWRMAAGSVANPNEPAKPWAFEAGRRAIRARLASASEAAEVRENLFPGHSRVVRPLASGTDASVLGEHPHGIAVQSHGPPWEILPIDSNSELSIGARWNRAARRATGSVLVFLSDLHPASPDWLEELLSQTVRPEIAVVGVRVTSRRRRLLHMGAVTGGPESVRVRTIPLHADEPGPMGLARSLREVSAVTGGCLAIRRDLFEALGGFDPGYRFGIHDIDLCVRARSRGLRILYDPHVECVSSLDTLPAFHAEDVDRLRRRWGDRLEDDPYYNPGWASEGDLFAPLFRRRRARR